MLKRADRLRPDDMTLMAYADGELSPVATEQVETWVAQSPALQSRVEAYLRSRAVLQAALAAPLHDPTPQQSSALIGALGLTVERERAGSVVPLRALPGPSPALSYALAAGLAALTIGFGGGLAWQGSVERAARAAAVSAADAAALRQAVALTLETSPNGRTVMVNGETGARLSITPLATFVTNDGEICREYQFGGVDQVATACRGENGHWQPRALAGRRT